MANKKAKKKSQARRSATIIQPKKEAVIVQVQQPITETSKPVASDVKKDNQKVTEAANKGAKKPVDNKKVKKVKEKKPSKVVKKTKETFSELKKVTWPKFPTVVKQTGIVLAVVVFFTVVLFGFDSLLGWIYNIFTKKI